MKSNYSHTSNLNKEGSRQKAAAFFDLIQGKREKNQKRKNINTSNKVQKYTCLEFFYYKQ